MAKKKDEVVEPVEVQAKVDVQSKVVRITPLTQEFGNGDLNTLRDKINELVKLNS